LTKYVIPCILLLEFQPLTTQKDKELQSGRQRDWVHAGVRAGA